MHLLGVGHVVVNFRIPHGIENVLKILLIDLVVLKGNVLFFVRLVELVSQLLLLNKELLLGCRHDLLLLRLALL